MSFTAEVKNELSRQNGECPTCILAEASALIRVCGSLSFSGSGHFSVRIKTETGAVARTIVTYAHRYLGIDTRLTVRHSVLHKSSNYLIEIVDQPGLADKLVRLGILLPGNRLETGLPEHLLQRQCCRNAFLRGAFMAGGFIADPRNDFHLEIAVTGEDLAQGIIELMGTLGITARLNRRRGAYAIYLKSFEDITALLTAMGASRSAQAIENVRRVKSVKNDVNRRVNAEIANSNRSSDAAVQQLLLIDEAERLIGLRKLPPAVREFCRLRRAYPELSLAALGQECDPPASKSALYHRLLRLQKLVQEAKEGDAGNEEEECRSGVQ